MATRRKPPKGHTPLLVCRTQRRWSSSTSRTTLRPRWPSSSTSSIWSARCPHLHHHLLPRQHCLLHHLLLSSVAFHLHLLLLGRPRRCVRSLRARLSPSTAAAARDAPARSAARGCCKPSASASAAPPSHRLRLHHLRMYVSSPLFPNRYARAAVDADDALTLFALERTELALGKKKIQGVDTPSQRRCEPPLPPPPPPPPPPHHHHHCEQQ